jgi:hypothetical protein
MTIVGDNGPELKAFDERVLLRLAGCDVVPVETGAIGPRRNGA